MGVINELWKRKIYEFLLQTDQLRKTDVDKTRKKGMLTKFIVAKFGYLLLMKNINFHNLMINTCHFFCIRPYEVWRVK